MSKDIYSIQRTLNEILDIEPEEYTISDSELFDISDYPKIQPWTGYGNPTHLKEFQFKKGHNTWNKGKKMSEQMREKCRLARLGTTNTPESNAKRSATMKGIKKSEETKRRMSEAQKQIGNKPPSMKGYKHSEESREKMRQSRLAYIQRTK